MRALLSLIVSVAFMTVLVLATPAENPSRLLVMLGGTMPEGVIQGAIYFLFAFGVLEVVECINRLNRESDAFHAHLLPEKENWVIGTEEVNQLKLEMQHFERSKKYFLTDLIIKSCIKYRLSKSSSEVLELVDSQVRIYNSEMETEQSFISYVAWAIPSVGFIGTVIGISASLGYANEAGTPEGLEKVTSMLAVAFDTTLIALLLSVVLMYLIHYMQKKQDAFFSTLNGYMIENMINRLYN